MRNTIDFDVYLRRFHDEWLKHRTPDTGAPAPLPKGYEVTVERWYNRGLTIESLLEAIAIAMNSVAPIQDKYLYLCGVAWNKVKQYPSTVKAGEESRLYTQKEVDRIRWEAFTKGMKMGMDEELDREYDEAQEWLKENGYK